MSTSKRVRGFYQQSRSWHRFATTVDGLEEFEVGVYHVEPDDGTEGEFMIAQERLGDDAPAWRLKAFDDAWRVLPEFSDVIAGLAGLGDNPSAEQIREMLSMCGLVDLTRETR